MRGQQDGAEALEPEAALDSPSVNAAHLPGRLIGNKYRIKRPVGRGGMGVVYETVDIILERRTAVKVLCAALAPLSEEAKQLCEEGRKLALVGHRNVVQVYEVSQDNDGSFFLAMEYLQGRTLGAWLRERDEPLPLYYALLVGEQLGQALAAMHDKQVIHRDLKPDNIMVLEPADDLTVKIFDFGVAKLQSTLSVSLQLVGTPRYMAPEQLHDGSTSASVDVYALGLVLFEMLTGRLPFDSESRDGASILAERNKKKPRSLSKCMEGAPPALSKLLNQMLSLEPTARPKMAEVASRLSTLLHEHEAASLAGRQGTPPAEDAAVAELSPSRGPITLKKFPMPASAQVRTPRRRDGRDGLVLRSSMQLRAGSARESGIRRWRSIGVAAGLSVLALVLVGVGLVAKLRLAPPPPALSTAVTPAPIEKRPQEAPPPRPVTPSFSDLVEIPEGEFEMGNTPAEIARLYEECQRSDVGCRREAFERAQPVHKVRQRKFFLERTEVTNFNFARYLNGRHQELVVTKDLDVFLNGPTGKVLVANLDPYYGGISYSKATRSFAVRPGAADKPVVQVTHEGATRYCAWRGRRLPTEAEWEYAASNGGTTEFPWGNQAPDCNRAALARLEPVSKKNKVAADYDSRCYVVGSKAGGVIPSVNATPGDRNAQGVQNLCGGVEEMVADCFVGKYQECAECKDPKVDDGLCNAERQRVVRGSSFALGSAQCHATVRSRWPESKPAASVGFRCAAD